MKQLLVKRKFRNWRSVFILIGLMFLVITVFRPIRLLELKSAEVEENKIKVEQVKKEAETIKKEKEELEVQLRIPNKERVYKEVDKLFGSYAQEAKKIISCENSTTEVDRIHLNKDKTADFGPFQINLIHAKRFGTRFMVDPIENVRVAYKLWQEQSWHPWYSSNHCHRLIYK